ncbi:superoxide dismutase [Cu-Zn] [Papilio machaon]|uniref:superoxide dismutase [Cu-Zn] n=1 Tax=Papilio machaon TaxID=76193 RepID=UPI001E66359F|nr:superoxide dismutase [Cu-Zn] [Papilio machaon]
MTLRLHIFLIQILCLVAVLNAKTIHGIPGYGRNLVVKSLPAIEDLQSNVYEVFMEPFLYGPRAAPGLQAVVYLQDDVESGVSGELVFTQVAPNGPVSIQGNITGLSAGLHGVHVHQSGDIDADCKKIGPHYIAYYGRHGGPRDPIRHVGDLGNVKAEEGETLHVKIIDELISLAGPRSIVGRSLAITKGEDDYGRAGTEESALTGTSGPVIACGVIGYLH